MYEDMMNYVHAHEDVARCVHSKIVRLPQFPKGGGSENQLVISLIHPYQASWKSKEVKGLDQVLTHELYLTRLVEAKDVDQQENQKRPEEDDSFIYGRRF